MACETFWYLEHSGGVHSTLPFVWDPSERHDVNSVLIRLFRLLLQKQIRIITAMVTTEEFFEYCERYGPCYDGRFLNRIILFYSAREFPLLIMTFEESVVYIAVQYDCGMADHMDLHNQQEYLLFLCPLLWWYNRVYMTISQTSRIWWNDYIRIS
jgi:hypothetical protein